MSGLHSARDWARRVLKDGRDRVDLVLRLPEGGTYGGRGRRRLERAAVDVLRVALSYSLLADDLALRASVRHELARLGRDGRGHKRMRVEPGQGIA